MQNASWMRDEAQEMFDRIDENGDRQISFEEFAALLRQMNRAQPEAELRATFDTLDRNHDGLANFDDFFAWVAR